MASAQVLAPELITGSHYIDQVSAEINNVDTQQLVELIEQDDGLVLIDVRQQNELPLSGGTIDAPRTFNVSRGWLEFQVPERVPNKDTPIVVFCGLNLRSPLAARQLMDMGYTQVYNYADGFPAWLEAGLPVTRDTAPRSMLFSDVIKVTDRIWSSIGATAPPTYENSGHNNNLTMVIGDESVLVVNAGDNYLLAQSFHAEVKKKTNLPVKFVILENGQGHAMLGSNYWQEQGAVVIAHEETAQEISHNGEEEFQNMLEGRLDKGMGTELVLPDVTFDEAYTLQLGNLEVQAKYLGPAHSPGDIVVWVPSESTVIAGDMAFHERLLPVMEDTDVLGWIDSWQNFVDLGARIVVPGHGGPTNYEEVTKYTVDYLSFLSEEIKTLIEKDGTLQDAYLIDQSSFDHLDTYFELARQNAGRVFRYMEFEF